MAGELSHKLDGRTDLPQYYAGCSILENMIPMAQGGVTSAPGTWYIAAAKQTDNVRLIPFIVSEDKAFVLEFGEKYFRVYKNRSQIQVTGSPYEVATDFVTDDLFGIKYAKISSKEMVLVHPNYPIKVITYVSDTNWTYANYTLSGTPPFNGGTGDYASVIAVHEDRLIVGASINKPNYIWGSRIGTYNDFALTGSPVADDPFELIINDLKDGEIKWILSVYSHLLIGAASGEAYIAGGTDGIITPLVGGAVFKRTSNFGSSNVQGKLIDGNTIFVQRSGGRILEYYWQNDLQAYVSPDLTIYADHISDNGYFKEFAYSNDPYNIIWFVSSSGILSLLVLQKESKAMGWCRIIPQKETSSNFNSIAIIPGANGDDVYVSVSRTINGSLVQYIEVFDPIDVQGLSNVTYLRSTSLWEGQTDTDISNITNANPAVVTVASGGDIPTDGDLIKITDVGGMTEVNDNVYYVKNVSGSTFELWTVSGTAKIDSTGWGTYTSGGTFKGVTNVVTGLSYLEGEKVKINADGGSVEPQIVSSGQITLTNYFNKIYVGLWQDRIIRPMRIEINLQSGSTQTKIKRINQVRFRLFNTLGGKVGYDLDNLSPILYDRDYLGVTPDTVTGDKSIAFAGRYSTEGWIYIVQDEPLPMTVLSIMPDMGIYGV